MKKIISMIIIDEDGIVSFEGDNQYEVYKFYKMKLKEAEEYGKRSVINNILKNIDKFCNQ